MSGARKTGALRLRREWEPRFRAFVVGDGAADPAHETLHLERVVKTALALAAEEGARIEVILPAAWLHDCAHVAKDSPERSHASRLSAGKAIAFLQAEGYPGAVLDDVRHAIEAHSYSAAIEPRTLEAQVVQDADRLDALGAVGLARCIAVAAVLGRPLYAPRDPFCRSRSPDDAVAAVDHFHTKLLGLAATMKTGAGRREARRRTAFLRAFLAELEREVAP